MTVKELREILCNIPNDVEVKLLSMSTDNINDNYDIAEVVFVEPFVGSNSYRKELVLIPE